VDPRAESVAIELYSPTTPVLASTDLSQKPAAQMAQTLGSRPPPQVSGAVHPPQYSEPPQPSETCPQLAPRAWHVFGVQQTFWAHSCGLLHAPQLREAPQPSEIDPHSAPSVAHVCGAQPHMFGLPLPPHVAGLEHVPHEPPQLSSPHSRPAQLGVHAVHASFAASVVSGAMHRYPTTPKHWDSPQGMSSVPSGTAPEQWHWAEPEPPPDAAP
jgi:hypothetical protein